MFYSDVLKFYKLALETVFQIGKILSMSFYGSNPYENILNILSDYLNVKRGMILIYDKQSDYLFPKAAVGIDSLQYNKLFYRPKEGIVGRVFSMGVSMMIPDIDEEPNFLGKIEREYNYEKTSFYAMTIKDSENVKYGVLAIDKDAYDVVNVKTEFDLLSMICIMLGNFIKQKIQIEENIKTLEEKNLRLSAQIITKYGFKEIVGKSKVMKNVFEKIHMLLKSKAPVLIIGESGTGKEVVAKTIHYNSERKNGPFVAINCAAIPAELIESEIFGYEKGAFTGAVSQKKGKFELAHGGTLFLDEIGDMPLSLQSKLLRILQEKEFERVGGTSTIKTDVRIIAATNKNLLEEVHKGNFRLDLFYRLNVFNIFLPPLRDRKEDIPYLVEHILKKMNNEYGLNKKIDKQIFAKLMNCDFPGNVRELENCIERAYFNSPSGVISFDDFSCNLCKITMPKMGTFESNDVQQSDNNNKNVDMKVDISPETYSEREKIIEALKKCGWVQAKAARLLGVTVRQLNYRIKKYNINIQKI
jgi:Nif-specific regulatory protein